MKTMKLPFTGLLFMGACLALFSTSEIRAVEPESNGNEELWPLDDDIDTPDALLRHRDNTTNPEITSRPEMPDTDQTKKDNLEDVISNDPSVRDAEDTVHTPEEVARPSYSETTVEKSVKSLGRVFQLEKGVKQDEQLTPDPLLDGL